MPLFGNNWKTGTMKIAATVILFVAALFVADNMYSGVSIGDTIQQDFLNLESSPQKSPVEASQQEERVIKSWIDTIRRERSRRQSRFC